MDPYHAGLDSLRMTLLLAGSVVVFIGVVKAIPKTLSQDPTRSTAQRILPHAALGLEFFVGATLLNLMLTPNWTAVQISAVTIAIRKLVTYAFDRQVS